MSDGWLYYFVSIVCLAAAVIILSLGYSCFDAASNDQKSRVQPLVPLRRWILILGCVLSVTGLAMFVTGISVSKDTGLVSRDTYFAVGGILLGASLCLLFLAVSLTTYHQVTTTVQGQGEKTPEIELDPLDSEQIELDPLDAEPALNLDPLDAENTATLDLLGGD